MIYLTVGVQLPFERLVNAMDEWAALNSGEEIFGQIGASNYVPKHFRSNNIISASESKRLMRTANLVVSHAGMGTIIERLEAQLPILVMPRRADLKEHRNDHQLATSGRFQARKGVYVAMDKAEMFDLLDKKSEFGDVFAVGTSASPSLLTVVSRFVNS